MAYNKKDFYHKKAKEEGYAARSAYKLQEIQKRFRVIKSGAHVLDLGCAPGAWSEVTLEILGNKGILVGLDLEPVTHIQNTNARFLQLDIFNLNISDLKEAPYDCILSDMAPKTTGIKLRDQTLSFELSKKSIELCDSLLKPGGNFVVKVFEGPDMKILETMIKERFQKLERFRPESTRQASKEIYLIGLAKK